MFSDSQSGLFRLLLDWPQPQTHGLSFSQRQCSVKVLHAEPKRNDLMAIGECKSLSLNFFLQSCYLFQSFVIILLSQKKYYFNYLIQNRFH